ncbi:hypothetical protein Dimus_001303 [Dionaea muscipula]
MTVDGGRRLSRRMASLPECTKKTNRPRAVRKHEDDQPLAQPNNTKLNRRRRRRRMDGGGSQTCGGLWWFEGCEVADSMWLSQSGRTAAVLGLLVGGGSRRRWRAPRREGATAGLGLSGGAAGSGSVVADEGGEWLAAAVEILVVSDA